MTVKYECLSGAKEKKCDRIKKVKDPVYSVSVLTRTGLHKSNNKTHKKTIKSKIYLNIGIMSSISN
jgi:hypothetical protein